MTSHTTTITGKCPHGCPDVYEAEFTTGRLIPVEVIQAAIACYTLAPVYQETLTRQLAECLQCRVTLKGSHGGFITTTTEGDS